MPTLRSHPSVHSTWSVLPPSVDSAVAVEEKQCPGHSFSTAWGPCDGPGQMMLAMLYVLSFADDLNSRVILGWGTRVLGSYAPQWLEAKDRSTGVRGKGQNVNMKIVCGEDKD